MSLESLTTNHIDLPVREVDPELQWVQGLLVRGQRVSAAQHGGDQAERDHAEDQLVWRPPQGEQQEADHGIDLKDVPVP